MKIEELVTLYDYNYWANELILEAAGSLSPEQFTAPAQLSFGSVRGTLVHALGTERLWRQRCQEAVSPTTMLSESDIPDMAALRRQWSAEEGAMRAYLGRLADPDQDRIVQYTNMRGIPFETPLWQILVHVVNHSTQFRSEAGVALTSLGHSPGDTDLIVYLRQLKK